MAWFAYRTYGRLEGMATYAAKLLAPAEGFGLRSRFFYPAGKERAYYAVLAHLRPCKFTTKTEPYDLYKNPYSLTTHKLL